VIILIVENNRNCNSNQNKKIKYGDIYQADNISIGK